MRWGILLLLTACGARLENPNSLDAPAIDAAVDTTVVTVDASPDAPRACTGGDGAMAAGDGSCIVLFVAPKTFADAQTACILFGSQLAILDSAVRDATAKALIGTQNVFFGLTDSAVEGTFKWVDGTPLVFKNFATGEPNNANGAFQEDCAIYSGTRGGWDDRPCAPDPATTIPGVNPYLCMF